MKTRLVTSLILALGSATSAAAQPSPAAPAQQVQPEAPSPAPAVPAAPAPAPPAVSVPPAAPPPPASPPALYQTPRGYVSPPQRYAAPPVRGEVQQAPAAAPPVYLQPRPYAVPRRPQLPPPEPAPPRKYGNAGAPVALGVGGVLLWRDEDHERFGNDRVGGGVNVFASYDLWAPSRVFVLAGGLDYRHDQRARTSLGALKENLLTADLTARVRAASWLWPQVRAGVGVAVTHIGLNDELASIKLDDREAGVAGSFGAGFTLRTPTRALETHHGTLASLSLGVLVEGGYTLAQDAELTPEPARGGDVRRASPGSLQVERSAAYLRILAVVRF